MSVSVNPPYPIFAEADGQPLENGYIWIGAANLDPQTNPINVYWDVGLTIPAAQPIRTLNGYVVYNGTPSRFFTNSNYSIRVMDKNGSTVYTSLSGNSFALSGGNDVFTATDGQTVFNLNFTYAPNTNSLFVFVNGSKQIVTLNYTESSNSVTFLTGLNVGDEVQFIGF
jgi:hypothetical protein